VVSSGLVFSLQLFDHVHSLNSPCKPIGTTAVLYTMYILYIHARKQCVGFSLFSFIGKIKKVIEITLLSVCVFHLDFLLLGYEITLLSLCLRVPPNFF
jgi:hypothetical protein